MTTATKLQTKPATKAATKAATVKASAYAVLFADVIAGKLGDNLKKFYVRAMDYHGKDSAKSFPRHAGERPTAKEAREFLEKRALNLTSGDKTGQQIFDGFILECPQALQALRKKHGNPTPVLAK